MTFFENNNINKVILENIKINILILIFSIDSDKNNIENIDIDKDILKNMDIDFDLRGF